jgi:hypothetical protein
VAANDHVWPRALKVSVADGERPQAAFWRTMQADPPSWTHDVRTGVREACDLLAWTGAAELDRLDAVSSQMREESDAWQAQAEASAAQSADLAQALALARREAGAAQAAAAAARAELETLVSSESWRVTAPLRGFGSAVRRLLRH